MNLEKIKEQKRQWYIENIDKIINPGVLINE